METVLLGMGASATTAATVSGVVSTVGTLLSAGIGIMSAVNQANTMQSQAELAKITAQSGLITSEMELLKGRQDANKIREGLLKTLASQRARYASAGLVLDSGTPATVEEVTNAEADRETQVVKTNAGMRAASQKISALNQQSRASLLEDSADWALIGGVGGSLLKGASALGNAADLLPGTEKLGNKLLN